jgi:hypothetical protein
MELNLACGHLSDDEFVAAFEQCTISPAAFHHVDHLRLAWIYTGRDDEEGAEEKLLVGIPRFAAKGVSIPNDRSQVATRCGFLKNSKAENTFGEWIASQPEFFGRWRLEKCYERTSCWVNPRALPAFRPNLHRSLDAWIPRGFARRMALC